jgi:hypothetical protein
LTSYKVGFKTSASGALAGVSGSTITIVLAAGTGFAQFGSTQVAVGTTQVGQCFHTTGTTLNCIIFNGSTVAASTTVSVTLNGVTNPATVSSSNTLTVATSSDVPAVTSPTYAITAGQSVSAVTVAVSSPSAAAGALTSYKVGFKTSASGALAGVSGSTISIVLAAGTGFGLFGSTQVMVGATQVGQCFHTTGTTLNCIIFNGSTVAASTTVAVTLNGVTNPATVSASNTLTVATSSDVPAVTSPTYAITAAKALTSGAVTTTNSLPSATGVTYNLSLKTSSSGALAGVTGSKITIVLPAATGMASMSGSSTVKVGTTQVGQCAHTTGTTASCTIFNGSTIAANATVAVSLIGLANPATASVYTATVSTTSDTLVKSTSGYCVVAAGVPCIATVAPASGGVGTGVTITRVNLTGATALSFHGTAAAILTNSATKITTTVPTGATTGTITVTTGGGTATSPTTFKVVPAPTISGFSPSSGPVGTTVTISGTNLTKATSVKFNGTPATVLTDTAGQITATVPAGASTGSITVTTAGGTATSATNFTVT